MRAVSVLGVSLVALFLAHPALAGIEVLSQQRRVAVDIEVSEALYASCIPLLDPLCQPDEVTTTNFSDSETAPDTSPFVETANDPAFPSTWASQDSLLGANRLRASGSHVAASSFWQSGGFPITFHSESHAAESSVVVDFSLAETTPYRLDGNVATSGGFTSSSSAWIRLSGPGGVVAEVQVDTDPNCTDPGCFTVGPEPLGATGTLAAGSYTLEAIASGNASGLHSTSGSFGGGMGGAFDVELLVGAAVLPGLGPPGLALLSLALGAGGVQRLRGV